MEKLLGVATSDLDISRNDTRMTLSAPTARVIESLAILLPLIERVRAYYKVASSGSTALLARLDVLMFNLKLPASRVFGR